jgi:hypothetical protein
VRYRINLPKEKLGEIVPFLEDILESSDGTSAWGLFGQSRYLSSVSDTSKKPRLRVRFSWFLVEVVWVLTILILKP